MYDVHLERVQDVHIERVDVHIERVGCPYGTVPYGHPFLPPPPFRNAPE